MWMPKSWLSALPFVAGVAAQQSAQQSCNGSPNLCDKRYNEIAQLGAHNAEFVGKTVMHDQKVYPEQLFPAGVRFFSTQVHQQDGTLDQCHTSCKLLDVGPLTDLITSLVNITDNNPDDVVTLLIGNGGGDTKADVSEFAKAFEDAQAKDKVFQPAKNMTSTTWPKMKDIIAGGKRLIVFMDYGADVAKVPYILDEFSYIAETPFSPQADKIHDCTLDRPSGADPNKYMIMINHNLNQAVTPENVAEDVLGGSNIFSSIFGSVSWLKNLGSSILVPDSSQISTTNSEADINKQVDDCQSKHNKKPNIVLVDEASTGDGKKVVDSLNAVSSKKKRASLQFRS